MASTETDSRERLRTPGWRPAIPFAVAFVLLVCYWLTLAPSTPGGDASELVTAVHTMSVAHPTGYPLYLIVGKLFDLIPLGEPAWRVALLSAVSGAAAGGLICWMLMSVTATALAGIAGGLLAGLNWWVWTAANQPEVYAFHAFLVSLLLAVFVLWLDEPTRRRLNLLAFFSGLALTHHRTSIFFIAPLLLWAVIATRPVSARLLLKTAGLGLLPLLLYLWLPWRSAHHPPIDWGNTSGSASNFLYHVSGRLFYQWAFANPVASALDDVKLSLARMWAQFGLIGLPLAAIGMVGLVRHRRYRPLGIGLVIAVALVFIWAAFYLVGDKEVFFMPGMMVVGVWGGAGVGFAAHAARAMKLGPQAARGVQVAVVVVVVVILPFHLVVGNWRTVDRSEQYGALESATAVAAGVPGNAVMMLHSDDAIGAALYYYYCYAPDARPMPLLLCISHVLDELWGPVHDPAIVEAASVARRMDSGEQIPGLLAAARERLAPERTLYTDAAIHSAPPGYVLLRDMSVSRLVPFPGVPQAPDPAGARAILELPGAAGSVLGVELPEQAQRGKPFPVTAAVRWAATAEPTGRLRFWFAHAAGGAPPAASREVLVLFGARLPASRPGSHYEQTVWVVLPRRIAPGPYRLSVQYVQDGIETRLVGVGSIAVS